MVNAAETILHSQHTSSLWLHLHLLITCCVSLMIFDKFLAASLLSSAHIALSENLHFLFLSFTDTTLIVLPACSWLTIALILTASPHACLFGFCFFFGLAFLPSFSSTWNFSLLPPPCFSLPSYFPPFVPSSQSHSCSDSCAQLLLLSLLSQLQRDGKRWQSADPG